MFITTQFCNPKMYYNDCNPNTVSLILYFKDSLLWPGGILKLYINIDMYYLCEAFVMWNGRRLTNRLLILVFIGFFKKSINL